jgi:hypothetical protein
VALQFTFKKYLKEKRRIMEFKYFSMQKYNLQKTPLKKECNKYDLTAAQCFSLAHHNDWSTWFAISSSPPICCPSFSFIAGVAQEYITKLGCEKYFRSVPY